MYRLDLNVKGHIRSGTTGEDGVNRLHFLARVDTGTGDNRLGQKLASEDHATWAFRNVLGTKAALTDRFEIQDLQELL